MGYKLLGFVVWRVATFYLRRRYSGLGTKVAIAGAGAAVLAGAIVAGRQVAGRQSSGQ